MDTAQEAKQRATRTREADRRAEITLGAVAPAMMLRRLVARMLYVSGQEMTDVLAFVDGHVRVKGDQYRGKVTYTEPCRVSMRAPDGSFFRNGDGSIRQVMSTRDVEAEDVPSTMGGLVRGAGLRCGRADIATTAIKNMSAEQVATVAAFLAERIDEATDGEGSKAGRNDWFPDGWRLAYDGAKKFGEMVRREDAAKGAA